MKFIHCFLIFMFMTCGYCFSADSIQVDGLFEDWETVPALHSDMEEQGLNEDFAQLKITNDNRFLFFKISFYQNEHLLQESNNIKFFIDTDKNSQTGRALPGMGAELEWCFGCREGVYHDAAGAVPFYQSDLVIRSAPTVTSAEFEIAIGLNSALMTSDGENIPDSLRIQFVSSDYSDLMPDESAPALYVIDTTQIDEPQPIPLTKNDAGHLRIISYNTLSSGMTDESRVPYFERIIKTLQPDIAAFQEQDNHVLVRQSMESWLTENNLYSVQMGNRNVVVSRHPILDQALLTQSGRTMAVLLETYTILGTNLLIMNSHLACCTNDQSRQNDADEIISLLRDWREGAGPFQIAGNTPIVHVGDFNLVGDSRQLKTLMEGDIVDELTYGDDFFPDWDNTPFSDLILRQTAIRMGYTWRDDQSSFSPGKLDYILYTDSNIEAGNHFILNTMAMSGDDLAYYELLKNDTDLASDHLPLVFDIIRPGASVIGETPNQLDDFQLFAAYPNPFNSVSKIEYYLPVSAYINLEIFDITGKKVKVLAYGIKKAGKHVAEFSAADLTSSVYIYKLSVPGYSRSGKVIFLK